MSRNATAQISQLRQRNIIRDPPKMRIDQRDACCSNETDGSMPIPWKTSKPLTRMLHRFPVWSVCPDDESSQAAERD